MKSILELRNIEKRFPGVLALNNINFKLEKGQIHAICGENGAGKSTLIKIIAGVYQPDKGEILIDGKPITIDNPYEGRELGISVIYQETSLFPDFSIMENLFIGREPKTGAIKHINYKQMKKEAEQVFNLLETDIDVTEKIEDLSVAQMQLVEIARALTFKSRIIIMDEPMSALSQKESESLFKVIMRLKENDVSIIYISHRLEEIHRIADIVTVIRDGKHINTSTISEVDNSKLVSWMVGREMDNFFPKEKVEMGESVLELVNINQEGVLKDICFSLRKGEILGISGLVGAGRTEMALAISGFTRINSGEILIDGKKVKINNYSDAIDKGLVYVSESRAVYGLILPMSVKHNLTLSILEKLCKGPFIKTKEENILCDDLIRNFGIKTPDSDFVVGNLSGGNQQKVSVSKGLAINPKIIILDEPTRGVDVGAKAEIHKIIVKLAKTGMAIIMISSEMPEILGMSDRVLVMKNGSVVGEFSREEMTQEKLLSCALGV